MPPAHLTNQNKSIDQAKAELDSLLKNRQALIFVRFNVLAVGLSWFLFGVFYQFLPPQIPLWFSRPWGDEQLTNKIYFVVLPLSLTLIFIINARLASLAIKRDKLLTQVILWGQLICSFLVLVTIVRIILLLA